METLLGVAIIVTALAITVQAGVLIAMYLMSKRVTENVNGLVSESKRMLGPVEHITENVQAASADLVVVGQIARDQMNHVALMVEDTHIALTQIASDVSDQVTDTVNGVQRKVLAPFRLASALVSGVERGLQVLVKGRDERSDLREYPAA